MTAYARRLPFGATYLGDGRTWFRLWAPGQKEVGVEIAGAGPTAMRRSTDGWFEAEAQCEPGTPYLYRLGTGEAVPDPASRAQASDVHGPSLVIDPASYAWRSSDWRGRPWHETVLYELHPGLAGGFRGIEAMLPQLAELGVTAIELMPISDFPGTRNWGYDGVLPFAPDRSYGTPDELKHLIDMAHERGMMMFLDVVYNHFGPDGNYLGLYAPQFFRRDIATPWGAAIDVRRPEVSRYFIENALYWLLEYRFDGLRFDAVQTIYDQAWLDTLAAEIRRTVEPGRHIHLVLEHEGNEAAHLSKGFDAQWNDDAHHCLHILLTGEQEGYYADYAADPARFLARCLSEGFAYQGEPSPHREGRKRGSPSAHLPPTSFVLFLQNHDQVGNRPLGNRLPDVTRPDALKAAVALQLLAPSIPLLFMGEETLSRTPFQFFTDFHGELAQAVRDGRRREFAYFKGFAGDLPDPNAVETFERCRLSGGDASFHRELLAIRHRAILPRLAGARAQGAEVLGRAAVCARWIMGDGAVLTIATNLGREDCAFVRPAGTTLAATGADAGRDRLVGDGTVAILELPG